MQIQLLRLENFRNFETEIFEFAPHQNLIFSPNGQGKTSLLEALSVAMTLRSFQKAKGAEILRHGKTEGFLALEFTSGRSRAPTEIHGEDAPSASHHRLFLHLTPQGRDLWIDEKKVQKASRLLEYFLPLFYSSEVVFLFKNEPEERRRLIDRVLSSLEGEYYSALKSYNLILKQKNSLLRFQSSLAEVSNWNHLASEAIAILTRQRFQLEREIGVRLAEIYQQYSCNPLTLELRYSTKFLNEGEVWSPEKIENFLNSKWENEARMGYALYGSHLDRFQLSLGGNLPMSEGQYCLAYYSLLKKIQELYLTRLDQPAILLVDDLFQGIDEKIKGQVLDGLYAVPDQYFLTSHQPVDSLLRTNSGQNRLFTLQSGQILSQQEF